jgi:hypothetical protein
MKDKFKVKEDNVYDYFIAPITNYDTWNIDKYITSYKASRIPDSKATILSKFKGEYGMHIENLIVYGDSNVASHHVLKDVIDSRVYIHRLGDDVNEQIKAYKCFDTPNAEYRIGITAIHSDSLSSWKCLLIKIGNPKFTIVYKIEKDGTKDK